MTFRPFALPSPTWSMSIVISASSAREESEITAASAAVVLVFSVLSMVSLVLRMDDPLSLMSMVNMFPLVWATVRDALTAVSVNS
ncbi:hypothetical protein D9M71_660440 [compost metagenome]